MLDQETYNSTPSRPGQGQPLGGLLSSRMNKIDFDAGLRKAIDALVAGRLALLCGAGLSMAEPSSIPSAAQLAASAKQKYDANFGSARSPLPVSIDDQANFFFARGELATVYIRSYIDPNVFSSRPNSGHYAVADLLLVRGASMAVSTNVDTLIEQSGDRLNGRVPVGTTKEDVARAPSSKSPLLKVHGCWSRPWETIWATNQLNQEEVKNRLHECSKWLEVSLLDRDLLIVGYSTDWNYLNLALESAIGTVNPTRVIVVDPCDTDSFAAKAPVLHDLGTRASIEFCHVQCSGDRFLDRLRVSFSQMFVRQMLHGGRDAYLESVGDEPDVSWLEPASEDARVLWQTRRDLEGCGPHDPATMRDPPEEPLLGLTMLQLRARGATPVGSLWSVDGRSIRIIRAPNRMLHVVEAEFSGESAPAAAPDVVIAVGAEAVSLPSSVARGSGSGTIVRGAASRWLSREGAVRELGL